MGLLDGLKSLLGIKAETDATRDADPEDLFGLSTVSVTTGRNQLRADG